MKIKKNWILKFYEHHDNRLSARVLTNAYTQFAYTKKTDDRDCSFFSRLQQRPFYRCSYIPREYELKYVLPSEFFT